MLVALQFFARSTKSATWRTANGLLGGWSQFDGPEYLHIVTRGYQQRQLVWFPGYPLLTRGVNLFTDQPLVAAVLVSAAAGLVAALLYWVWLGLMGIDDQARPTLHVVWLLYPYGFFLYGVVYSDALFVAFALGAFVLLERDRPGLAALAAIGATATRPTGFAVVAGLVVVGLERSSVLTRAVDPTTWTGRIGLPTKVDWSRLRPTHAFPLAGLTGLGAYMAYQWVAWGAPARFASEQANYHAPGKATALKLQYFDAFSTGYDARYLITSTVQGLLLALAVLAVPAVGRRFGWGYATYVFCLALLPAATSGTFMGSGRYLLPAFPLFALVGDWLASRSPARAAWLVTSGACLLLLAFGFSRSWYLT